MADALPKKENRKKKEPECEAISCDKKGEKNLQWSEHFIPLHDVYDESCIKVLEWISAALVLLSSVKTTKYFLFNKNALGLKGSLSILRAFWRRQHGRKTKKNKTKKPKQPVCCLRRPPWRDWCHHSLALCYLVGSWWVLFIYFHFCTHTWLLAVS